jgi:hypothetical protein
VTADEAAKARIVERTIRQFRFADELLADGLVSPGGARDMKRLAVFWASYDQGLEGKSGRNVRIPHGRKMTAGDGYDIEHAVPMAVVVALVDETGLDPELVWHVLTTYLVTYYIPKEEHTRINRMGLRNAMPADWDLVDPLARYRAAGLDLTGYLELP